MRITWVNPAFAEYRVPVYAALARLVGGNLTVVFSKCRTSPRVCEKIESVLGAGAVGLKGERKLRSTAKLEGFANRGIHIPYQPGLLDAIADSKPDVIVSEGFFQWTPASILFRIVQRVPLVIAYERTAHTERNAGFIRHRYRRLVSKITDGIVCNGSLSREYCMNQLGISSARIVTGAMAADTEGLARQCAEASAEHHGSGAAGGSGNGPRFLYVGRLIRLKGLQELLQGWLLFCEQEPRSGSLTLVGEGPERADLEKLVSDLRLRNVRFAGAANYDSIAGHYASADALVMPSLEDNWSLVVPEAMACGLPVLCSRYNGCWPELVKENVNGWVFDPTDASAVAQVLSDATRAAGRLAEMGQASRQIVQAYSPARAAGAVLQGCEQACRLRSHRSCFAGRTGMVLGGRQEGLT